MSSIKKFTQKNILKFEKVTVDFLNDYESFMLENGKTSTTVGIWLRCLRKLFNDYIEDNDLHKNKIYPFGKNKYQIPQGRKTKKALNTEELKKIFDYIPDDTTNELLAHNILIFSYLSNGINISDILRLKNKNIDGEKITFIREKTKKTTKSNQVSIDFILNEKSKEIIKRWSKSDLNDAYIFPFLQKEDTEEQKRNKIKNLTKTINKYLKKIGNKLEIEILLTTYVARHSYATMLKRKGVPTEYIKDTLGHSSVLVTENYLDSFEDDIQEQYTKLLTDF